MAFALINDVGAVSGSSPVTTGAIDTTGANLIVVGVTQYAGVGAGSLTDSKSNSYTGRTATSAAVSYNRIFDILNPTVGSGHTFTYDNTTSIYGGPAAGAFSGAHASASFDQQNGATGSSITSLATGSVTPSEDNELIIASISIGDGQSGTISIDSGFTILEQFAHGTNGAEALALAYKIQTSAAAVNPTWSWTGSAVDASARIATYKAAAGGGGVVGPLTSGHLVGGGILMGGRLV